MVLKAKRKLLLIKTDKDYVVVHTGTHGHSHFQDYDGAVACMDFFYDRRRKPKGAYMKEAVRRLRSG